MKTLGIILAAGKSSRLYPTTLGVTKQLLPIYDKPLIYYPLSTLMLAGIKDIAIIVSPSEYDVFKRLFDQNHLAELGVDIKFIAQTAPRGIADALLLADDWYDMRDRKGFKTGFDRTCLILGDNFFYGAGLTGELRKANKTKNPVVFATKVKDPERFGVVEIKDFDLKFKTSISIEEKPEKPKSNLAVTGLYFYPNSVYEHARNLKPSARGELEITDINKIYNETQELRVIPLQRGITWFDTGTFDSMMEAGHFVQTIQKQQGFLVGSPHEIGYNSGWISKDVMLKVAARFKNSYGEYLKEMVEHG